jgi:diadenosine tetraphosphatase ApaH/serine/threonine PP2A family protein phosphatase
MSDVTDPEGTRNGNGNGNGCGYGLSTVDGRLHIMSGPMVNAAFISDIHANLEALQKVLADIDARGIKEIYCLGDVVGYGPDPEACIDLVMARCQATIKGNHDEAVVHGPVGFNPVARTSIEWTHKRLVPKFWNPLSRRRWQFLQELPVSHTWEGMLLVHGSPRDPISEYIMDRDILFGPPNMFPEIFSRFERVCLVGHTHIPGVFYEGPRFVPQRETPERIEFNGTKMVINVGSVGQPRDHDPRASYVTWQDSVFSFHRLEYDFRTTQRKLGAHPRLDPRLAERLAEGV